MADIPNIGGIILPQAIQDAINSNLASIPTVKNAIASLKALGVDTSQHESQIAALEATMNNLLSTFGNK